MRLVTGEAPFIVSPCCFIYAGEDHYAENKGVSELYRPHVDYPKVPLIHPYNVTDYGRINAGVLSTPLVIHFPVSTRNHLPDVIRNKLEQTNIQNEGLKIFLSSQDFPWEAGTTTCFRPQYATDPQATAEHYDKLRKLTVGLFHSEENRVFFKDPAASEFIVEDFSAHRQGGEEVSANMTILSAAKPEICGLSFEQGASFWSYVGYEEDGKPKAIVTLHWILNDEQTALLCSRPTREELIGLSGSNLDPIAHEGTWFFKDMKKEDLTNFFLRLSSQNAFFNSEQEHFSKLLLLWVNDPTSQN